MTNCNEKLTYGITPQMVAETVKRYRDSAGKDGSLVENKVFPSENGTYLIARREIDVEP